MKAPVRQHREAAEMLAIQALTYIAERPETLSRFLDSSGIAADQMRAASRQPDFLAGVLEHMLGDENLLLAFAQSLGIDPAEIARASDALGRRWERDLP
jgi:hypothetical protein